MYTIKPTTRFQKDLKRAQKRGCDLTLLTAIIGKLQQREPLPARNRDHDLGGNYAGFRECHIAPDWLLIYAVDAEQETLFLTRTGSHSDLFD